jgi:hypothetical protein
MRWSTFNAARVTIVRQLSKRILPPAVRRNSGPQEGVGREKAQNAQKKTRRTPVVRMSRSRVFWVYAPLALFCGYSGG